MFRTSETIYKRLTPYETIFGRPYRLPYFENMWETDDESTLADYIRKMLQQQKRLTNQTNDDAPSVSPQENQLVEPGD